eukprot:TRINITY_DN23417_c1_g1_i1.p1 TRINITY_DN23417_c1_g1~~TRINITY_DN23417_c1_g1_i1.p1  ORF type:complete len:216 (+),score=27.50 TRINITY_DN23417_c1_g1_i1:79-648(+)
MGGAERSSAHRRADLLAAVCGADVPHCSLRDVRASPPPALEAASRRPFSAGPRSAGVWVSGRAPAPLRQPSAGADGSALASRPTSARRAAVAAPSLLNASGAMSGLRCGAPAANASRLTTAPLSARSRPATARQPTVRPLSSVSEVSRPPDLSCYRLGLLSENVEVLLAMRDQQERRLSVCSTPVSPPD